ncbi:deoxyribodipyrimidine photo-lyase, partial [bacterium]|nr:deoxyribodipyrimidine photo-lyase [bacterium]
MAALVWFRLDLRLADNPALEAAVRRGRPVIPVFIWAPAEEGDWAPGAASRWWVHHSLAALQASLRQRGSDLVIRRGPTLDTLRGLVRETGARAVCWNRRYEPAVVARDTRIKEALAADNLEVESFNAALLFEPWTIRNAAGKPFRVFTPFWRTCLGHVNEIGSAGAPSTLLRAFGSRLPAPETWPKSLALAELGLEPKNDWAAGLRSAWRPGEDGAQARLNQFVADGLAGYPRNRDRPDLDGVSRLSPHLHFGELSPRQVFRALRQRRSAAAAAYRRQLGWREFAHHLLFHFPRTPAEPLREEFAGFPWRTDTTGRRAWQQGRTGYPIVDAGMRELRSTGWMHN